MRQENSMNSSLGQAPNSVKASVMFRDQVNSLTGWFQSWNECEQTVALYSLLLKVTQTQAKFLAEVLNQSIVNDTCNLEQLETEANDARYVNSFSTDPENAVRMLLSHLPLLKPGNDEAKAAYLCLIPGALKHTVEAGQQMEEARQLLSYSLIHPAITAEERAMFNGWLAQLEERYKECHHKEPERNGWNNWGQNCSDHPSLHSSLSGPPAPSSHSDRRVCRGSALSTSGNWSAYEEHSPDLSSGASAVNDSKIVTVSSGHAPLSPQGSATSSGSNSDHDASLPVHIKPGMADVPNWLKYLRLHKYQDLFMSLSYEEMLGLSKEWLEKKGVTQGARDKIMLSVSKLHEREQLLKRMDLEIADAANLEKILKEMDSILTTPIQPYQSKGVDTSSVVEVAAAAASGTDLSDVASDSQVDLPGMITTMLQKIYSQLLMNTMEDELMNSYAKLLDRTLEMEAFNTKQRKLVENWKLQIHKIWQPRYVEKQRNRNMNPMMHASGRRLVRTGSSPLTSMQTSWSFGSNKPMRGYHQSLSPKNSLYRKGNGGYSGSTSRMETAMKTPLSRTHSAPIKSNMLSRAVQHGANFMNDESEPEINARLDSLCLSMTEHALGSFDCADKGSTF